MAKFPPLMVIVLLSNCWHYCHCACELLSDEVTQVTCEKFEDISTISGKINVTSLIVQSQQTPLPCNYPILLDFPNLEHFENRDGYIPFIESPCLVGVNSISSLHLTSNKIVWIDFKAFNGRPITDLELGENHIRTASLDGVSMSHLKSLNLSENLLTSFTISSSNAPQLHTLLLNSNKLVTFMIESETIWQLHMAGNALQSFRKEHLNVPNLSFLNLNNNNLHELTADMLEHLPKLTGLFLNSNSFIRVVFPSPNQLFTVSVSSDKIRSLNFMQFGVTTTQHLDLSNSRLYELRPEIRVLTNLTIFACENCHLHFVDPEFIMDTMANVQYIFLQRNFIRSLELLRSRSREPLNLEDLYISYNLIESISRADLAHVPKMKSLMLEFNKIRTIEDGAFDQMTSLEELNLGYNCILNVPDNLFHGSLKSVVLKYNLLTRLPIPKCSDRRLANLEKLNIFGNPLQCSCYNEFLDWMSTCSLDQYELLSSDYISDGNSPVCIATNTDCSDTFEAPSAVRSRVRAHKFEDHIYGQCSD